MCWKPDTQNEGISIPWQKVTLHATQMQPVPSVYVMLDFYLQWPGVYEGARHNHANGNGNIEDDDVDEGNESDEGK